MIAAIRILKKDVVRGTKEEVIAGLEFQLEVLKNDILREFEKKKWQFKPDE